MARLARDRDTHLTPDEIAAEALRQFDAGATEPSIRQLSAVLQVAPAAIYHHFESRAAVYQAAVDLVWQEATQDFLDIVPDPMTADPADVLVGASVATRRAFLRHHRVAPYVAATPAAEGPMANVLALVAALLERLGLEGEEAAACFHTYSSLTLGAVIFAAQRRIADELEPQVADGERFRSTPDPDARGGASETTRAALDGVMDVSTVDPARDEELFAGGLRRLVASFEASAAAAASAAASDA